MSKTILITGPTNGIGRVTALTLAAQGHKLVLLCRNKSLGESLCDEIMQLENAQSPILLIADLGNMEQVREAAETFLASGEDLHILINNAGVVNTERKLVDVHGSEQEQMFAVNHLGHFLLTRLLLGRLQESAKKAGCPSRIVVVASEAHAIFCKDMGFDDLSREKSFSGFKVYGQTKLANILMVRELAKQLDPNVVRVNCLHPGAVKSNLGVNNGQHWYTRIVTAILHLFFITPEKGAETSIFLATEDVSTHGEYYYRKKLHRLKPWAKDDAAAARLWQVSEKILQFGDNAST